MPVEKGGRKWQGRTILRFGGSKAVKTESKDIFRWPNITKEDEKAVLEVLHRGGMSGSDVTIKFRTPDIGAALTDDTIKIFI